MLNNRQKLIIKDLETSAIPITAKQLSSKYNTSLRTIRNDIKEIALYMRENNVEFFRIPGQGMQIVTDKKISENFNQILINSNYPYLEPRQRSVLLMMQFLFLDNPLSTIDLCESFQVSKGTMFSAIKNTNDSIKDYNLEIVRYQNKGYKLSGKLKGMVKYLENLLSKEGEQFIYETLIHSENGYISSQDIDKIKELLKFISNDLSLYISHHYFLSVVLYCLVCKAKNNMRSFIDNNIDDDQTIKLLRYVENSFNVHFNKEAYMMFRYSLSYATDYSDNTHISDIDERLSEAIDAMIDYVNSSGMYQSDDENLRIDLLVHLKSSINAISSGLPRDNPLLDDIRKTYPNEFNLIKSACQRFYQVYPIDFSEDEIGFITLYFLKSFDKSEKIHDTNVMVVCNTGRSASRLLATRLMNNIPDIHIVSMNSIYNIANDPAALDNVDFVISTIPLDNIKKPHIVISPLLQRNEINKVKEAIWISKRDVSSEASIDEIASSVVEQYANLKGDGNYETNNMIPYSVTALLGEVSMNLITLISDLYPEKIPASKYGNISGIFAHVLMSVPRWQRGEFIRPSDDEQMIKKYSREYEIIKKYLKEESVRLGIYIPETEVMTILRYYIY